MGCLYLLTSSGQLRTYELLLVIPFHRRADSVEDIFVVAYESLDIYTDYSDTSFLDDDNSSYL